jgi:hypothetical protein
MVTLERVCSGGEHTAYFEICSLQEEMTINHIRRVAGAILWYYVFAWQTFKKKHNNQLMNHPLVLSSFLQCIY